MKRLMFTAIILIVVLAAAFTAIAIPTAGGQDDPVVSLSYLENVFLTKVKDYIDSRLPQNTPKPEAPAFKVVQLKAGQSIIGGAGCEMVVRMGSGKILATAKGGVADLTGGSDLANGVAVPSNHHLLAPIADSRGIVATTDMIVLVKGEYTVK